MSYRGLKIAVGLALALCCGITYVASSPDRIVVREPIAIIPWGVVKSLAFSPDGKYLAVVGQPSQWIAPKGHMMDDGGGLIPEAQRKEGAVAVWRVADWQRVTTPVLDAFYREDAHNTKLVWAPDSARLAIFDTVRTLNKGGDADALKDRYSVWNIDGWRLISMTELHLDGRSLAISPDGGACVSPIWDNASGDSHEIGIWDLHTGSLKYRLEVNMDATAKLRRPNANTNEAVYTSDGKLLAVSDGDLVCLVSVETRAVISWRRFDNVRHVQFQPNTHNLLVLYGNSYQILAAPDLKPVLPPVSANPSFDHSEVTGVQFVRNGKWFAVANVSFKGDGFKDIRSTISLVETASMRTIGTIGPVKSFGSAFALSPDASKVVFGTCEIRGDFGFGDGHLFVFPTSQHGGPTPDEWLKAHPSSTTPVAAHPTLPHNTPPGTPHAPPVPIPIRVPAP